MFKLVVNLPYCGEVRVGELTNRDIFTIIKYCTAQDMPGLSEFLDDLIFSKLPPLNIVDKFYLLLFLRSFYISDILQVKIKHEKVNHMDFYIETMLERIDNLTYVDVKEIKVGDIILQLQLPSSFYQSGNETIVFDCIKSIQIDEDIYELAALSTLERDKILAALPGAITNDIYTHYQFLCDKKLEAIMLDSYPDYEVQEVKVRMLSNDPLQFIMMMFMQDISDFLAFMYHYVNKVGGTFNDFLDLTINDSKLIFDFYQEEMMKQNESLNNKQ
jgi:hypothetical protein